MKLFKRDTNTNEPETSKSKWRTKRDIQSDCVTIVEPKQKLVFNPNMYVSCLDWNYGATNRNTMVYTDNSPWRRTYTYDAVR